jgi:hypothetical protein
MSIVAGLRAPDSPNLPAQTAGRGFVFREEAKETGEEGVDGDGGAKFLEGGGVGVLALIFREAGVAGAEGGVDIGGGETAAPAVGEAIGAASGVVDKVGFGASAERCICCLAPWRCCWPSDTGTCQFCCWRGARRGSTSCVA